MKDIKYDFDSLLTIPKANETEELRSNLRIIKCCGNCRYAWFGHSNERRGYCRIGQLKKAAPNRDTPHPDWINAKTHATLLCDAHIFKKKGHWNDYVSKWIELVFDTNGETVKD